MLACQYFEPYSKGEGNDNVRKRVISGGTLDKFAKLDQVES
ncbi:hypothetical protein [Wolbachia endosymbiont of Onchocerca ochengi]|nr:hypothetical protein [Wolbachia endosymbiont of Onchocerca ochengi]